MPELGTVSGSARVCASGRVHRRAGAATTSRHVQRGGQPALRFPTHHAGRRAGASPSAANYIHKMANCPLRRFC
eukprot:1923388-Pyramimonas_sp.AAC.1